jgi:hypothetical protein
MFVAAIQKAGHLPTILFTPRDFAYTSGPQWSYNYQVQPGDSLYRIARRFNVSLTNSPE